MPVTPPPSAPRSPPAGCASRKQAGRSASAGRRNEAGRRGGAVSQLALPLDWPAAEDARDFIVTAANTAAVAHFERWSMWPVMATLLLGPRKSGRSLLGRIVAARTGGELADDAEGWDEEALFHAWNRAQARRRPLVIVADSAPPAWEVTLPDLASRLAATPRIILGHPDEALAAGLLERLLEARGLPAAPELVRYLVPRIERTHLGVLRAVETLDALAYERRQAPTVPLARAALVRLGLRLAEG